MKGTGTSAAPYTAPDTTIHMVQLSYRILGESDGRGSADIGEGDFEGTVIGGGIEEG